MMRLLIAAVGISLMLTACGAEVVTTDVPAAEGESTAKEAVAPTKAAAILPTPTPVPAPPTPTPLPTNTPPPTVEAATSEESGDALPSPTTIPPVTDAMVEIPGGPFTMGGESFSPDEGPPHEVDVPTFQMDMFEVTNADFSVFVDAASYETDAEKNKASRTWRDEYATGEENHPVTRVTWNDATAYCAWLGKRLPTEAEWEKAARGPDNLTYPWGDQWDATKANGKESGLRGTTAVGSYPQNGYGLFDVAGNVWEWTTDWYQPYPGNTTEGKFYGEEFRVIRGGGWFDEASELVMYNRNAADPNGTANDDVGFRCAK